MESEKKKEHARWMERRDAQRDSPAHLRYSRKGWMRKGMRGQRETREGIGTHRARRCIEVWKESPIHNALDTHTRTKFTNLGRFSLVVSILPLPLWEPSASSRGTCCLSHHLPFIRPPQFSLFPLHRSSRSCMFIHYTLRYIHTYINCRDARNANLTHNVRVVPTARIVEST